MIWIAAGPMITMNSAGRMQKISGKRIFTGTFCAISSARWRALDPHLRGLDAQHVGDRDAERVGLHHRGDEAAQLGHVGALAEGAHRVGAARADLHLLQHAEELLGERARRVAGDLGERGVEAQAGLDRDRQQVERVGQLAPHLLGAVVAGW